MKVNNGQIYPPSITDRLERLKAHFQKNEQSDNCPTIECDCDTPVIKSAFNQGFTKTPVRPFTSWSKGK